MSKEQIIDTAFYRYSEATPKAPDFPWRKDLTHIVNEIITYVGNEPGFRLHVNDVWEIHVTTEDENAIRSAVIYKFHGLFYIHADTGPTVINDRLLTTEVVLDQLFHFFLG